MDKLDPSHELEEPEGLKPDHELPTSSGLDPEHELPSGQNQRIGGGENSENSEKSENSETHNLAQTREIREGKIHSEEEQLKEKVDKLDAKRPKLVWISIALLGVLLILGVFFYIISGRMSKHNQDMVSSVSPTATFTPTPTPLPMGFIDQEKRTYTNTTYSFSLQYPQGWSGKIPNNGHLVIFSTPDAPLGRIEVTIYPESEKYKDTFLQEVFGISDKGNSDIISIQDRKINGLMVKEVHHRNGCISLNDCITVIVEVNGGILEFHPWVEGERYQDLKTIYSIISTLNSTDSHEVLCTQEVKQCPDGSYVGRTGPNCSFAPCPGN